MEEQGTPLQTHVQEEFDTYLKRGRLEHGFLRTVFEFLNKEFEHCTLVRSLNAVSHICILAYAG